MKHVYIGLFLLSILIFVKTDSSSYLKKFHNESLTIPTEVKMYKGNCFIKIKNNFYDLNPLNAINSYKLKGLNGTPIYFNFCSDVETSCNNQAMVVSKEKCNRFSGFSNQEKTWTLSNNTNTSILTVTLPEGDICRKEVDKVIKYTTSFEISCDNKVKDVVFTNEKDFNPKRCNNIIQLKSKYGIEYII